METPDTFSHLFWGYAAIWLLIAMFVLVLAGHQRRQLKRLRSLEEKLGSEQESGSAASGRATGNES